MRNARYEADASLAGLAIAVALRAVEVATVVVVGLLVCPPLAILVVVVALPLLVTALVLGLLAAVVSTPYLLVHHFRGHHGDHAALLAHRLRGAGRALLDLAPHRIVADARSTPADDRVALTVLAAWELRAAGLVEPRRRCIPAPNGL